MADPLASVVGLVAVGAKLGMVLNDFIRAVYDAPQSIRYVRNELYAVNAALCQIQSWLGDEKTRPPNNIQKDVKTIVESCEDTFNGLEVAIENLRPGTWNRMLWPTKEKQVSTLLRRLESHKAGLNLIMTVVSGQTSARVEDRLDRIGYLLGHMVRSQRQVAKRIRAMEKGGKNDQTPAPSYAATLYDANPGEISTGGPSTDPFADPSHNNGVEESFHTFSADPEVSLQDVLTQTGPSDKALEYGLDFQTQGPLLLSHHAYSASHVHPAVAVSQIQDKRRLSTLSDLTATESDISGISDRTLSDLPMDEILRPSSIYSLTPMTTTSLQTSSNDVIGKGSKERNRRIATLNQILTRKTKEPWSLFDFYIYMRDVVRSVDYLDCWLDIMEHSSLCRTYVRLLRQQILLDEHNTLENLDSGINMSISNAPSSLAPQASSRQNNATTADNNNEEVRRSDLRTSAEQLLYTYLLPGSEREIVVPESILNSIQEAIEGPGHRCDPLIFEDLQIHIFRAMERDAYPHFMKRRRAMRRNLTQSPLRMFRNLSERFTYESIAEEESSSVLLPALPLSITASSSPMPHIHPEEVFWILSSG